MSESKKPPIKWVTPPEGVPEYYANMVNILWSLDDVRLKIGQLIDDPADTPPGTNFTPIAQATAAVTISWRNAKLLLADLAQLIASYEKVNGEITTKIQLAPTKEEANEPISQAD